VTNPFYGGLPNIVISSFSGSLGVGGRTGIRGPDGEAQFEDAVSYLRGKHAFKFGFEYVDAVLDQDAYGQAQGVIKFSTLQSYLQGTVNTAAILAGDPTVNVRQHWFAGFVQDDWRITQRINLSWGLRYEYYAAPTERDNLLGTFNPNMNPATIPAVQQIGPGQLSFIPEKTDFLPGVGIAWDVRGNGKTVVRAGGGLMSSVVPITALTPQVPWGANFPSIGVNTTGTSANLHTPNP
jgi:outer membrane receptor protein involved in Fe transport